MFGRRASSINGTIKSHGTVNGAPNARERDMLAGALRGRRAPRDSMARDCAATRILLVNPLDLRYNDIVKK